MRGAFVHADPLSTTPETLWLMIDVNLGPALWLSQAVAPHMQRQGSGVIVHGPPAQDSSQPEVWRPTA